MKVAVPGITNVNSINILRKDGYWITKEDKEILATKPFGKKRYPRFHLKLSKENEKGPTYLELHIDWERPKHSQYWGKCATEDDETIRGEVERLKVLLLGR
ncbi:MAG: hypothetical protein JSV43_03540 [Methanobacteriota archaeon]|nr:MAG: hypothetical protein JSV43_03540 [Euryarchaeota archaeon]